ncbi:UNVERIFIED_ORG: hypothetical protein GGI57_005279 [Rhizobium aethiopicum]
MHRAERELVFTGISSFKVLGGPVEFAQYTSEQSTRLADYGRHMLNEPVGNVGNNLGCKADLFDYIKRFYCPKRGRSTMANSARGSLKTRWYQLGVRKISGNLSGPMCFRLENWANNDDSLVKSSGRAFCLLIAIPMI